MEGYGFLTEQALETERESLERRLDYARFSLAQTAEPPENTAFDCGWENRDYFAAAFQSEVGVTPEHYRRWHQG